MFSKIARDQNLRLGGGRAAEFRAQSPLRFRNTLTIATSSENGHGQTNQPPRQPPTPPNLFFPPTQPSKWRTSAERLSTCKRPPRKPENHTRESLPRLAAHSSRRNKAYHTNAFLFFAQLRPPQVQRDQPHHQGQGPRLRPDLHRQG